MHYLSRDLEFRFLEMSSYFKCVLLIGARQVGKSTMLKHLAQNSSRNYVNMDDERARELATSDPEMFFQIYSPPILIDEIQKAPQLLERIKLICDSSQERGLFWLTGSQRSKLMEQARETLAGRLGILHLYGLNKNEKQNMKNEASIDFSFSSLKKRSEKTSIADAPKIFEDIIKGGYPDVQPMPERVRYEYYRSYVENYLISDAVNDEGISDVSSFRKFIRACASLTSQMLNYKLLSETVGISQQTSKKWISVLEDMDVIYLLEPFANNRLKRLVRTPKLYFCDTGLCSYLTGWNTADTLLKGAFAGAIFETSVVMEFVKKLEYSSSVGRLSYYRDQNKKEIDLILERDGFVNPFEIKLNAHPNSREVRKFAVLKNGDIKIGNGGLICMASEVFPIDRNNCYIPCSLI